MNITRVSDEPVRLQEAGHIYTVGVGITEREVPSLSRVLQSAGLATDYSAIDVDLLRFRAQVGNCVHRAIHSFLSGFSEQASLRDEDRFVELHSECHFEAFLKWAKGHDLEPAFTEIPAYQPIWKFACTADFVGTIDDMPWILDWKTTSRISKFVALQTQGQEMCFRFEPDGGPEIAPKRGALHLPKKGPAKVVGFNPSALDYDTVRAAATVWNAKARYA